MTSLRRRGTTDVATGTAAARRGLRRWFRPIDDLDRSSRRAGTDPFQRIPVTPRVWVALG